MNSPGWEITSLGRGYALIIAIFLGYEWGASAAVTCSQHGNLMIAGLHRPSWIGLQLSHVRARRVAAPARSRVRLTHQWRGVEAHSYPEGAQRQNIGPAQKWPQAKPVGNVGCEQESERGQAGVDFLEWRLSVDWRVETRRLDEDSGLAGVRGLPAGS